MHLNLDNICLEQFSKTYKNKLENLDSDILQHIKTAIGFYINNLATCNQQQISDSINATQTQSQATILHIIAKFGDNLQLKQLVPLLNQQQLNATDRHNLNAIHHAVLGENLDNVKLLHQAGVNINCISDDFTRNLHAIHFASKFNMVEMLDFFLQQQVSIEQKTIFGLTALHIACEFNSLTSVEFLLSHSANIEAKTHEENHCLTPFLYAVIHNHQQIIELLMQHHANVYVVDNSDNDALYFATKFNHAKLLGTLIDLGVGNLELAKKTATEYNLDTCLEVLDKYLELKKMLFDINQIIILAQPLFFELEKINQQNAKTIKLNLKEYEFGLGFLSNIFIYTGIFTKEKISFIAFLEYHDLEFLANKLLKCLKFLQM